MPSMFSVHLEHKEGESDLEGLVNMFVKQCFKQRPKTPKNDNLYNYFVTFFKTTFFSLLIGKRKKEKENRVKTQ